MDGEKARNSYWMGLAGGAGIGAVVAEFAAHNPISALELTGVGLIPLLAEGFFYNVSQAREDTVSQYPYAKATMKGLGWAALRVAPAATLQLLGMHDYAAYAGIATLGFMVGLRSDQRSNRRRL